MKDWKTTNRSFVKIARELKNKYGVKNHDFMLQLYDPSLQGVDPFDKELTDYQKVAIYIECTKNRWYFIREVSRIPVSGNNIPYELNLGNLALTFIKSMDTNQVTLLPRQTGKTIGVIVDDVWAFYFGTTNTYFSYLNKSFSDSKNNLRRFKDIRDLLPDYLLEIVIDSDDSDAQEKKVSANFKNALYAKSSPMNPDAAMNLGRGTTTSIVYVDEMAFLKFNDIIYGALAPAWSKAADAAEDQGVPYGLTITTTPNNKDVPAGEFVLNEIIEQATPMRWEMYDMTREELKKFVDDNSSINFVYIKYTWRELGRSDKWYKQICKRLLGKTIDIAREIDLEWTLASDDSVFSQDQLAIVKQYVVDRPVVSLPLLDNRYYLDFYEMPDSNEKYIVSCDVAGGLLKDNSAINIIDPITFEVIGDFRNSKIDTDAFRELIKQIITLYFPNSILIIERNSYGLNIIQSLIKIPKIERRMYKEQKELIGEKKLMNGRVVNSKTKIWKYGVDTSTISKKIMFDILPTIVEYEPSVFKSPNIFGDLTNLIIDNRNKISHRKHDDNLMAYLVFRYALHSGKDLTQRFKISKIPGSRDIYNANKDTEIHDNFATNVSLLNRDSDKTIGENSSNMWSTLQRDIDKYKKLNQDLKQPDYIPKETMFNKIINLNHDSVDSDTFK